MGRGLEYGAHVTELEEAFAAVVMAHAGGANPAKRCVVHGRVHHHVVDGHTARKGVLQHMPALFFALAKVIQGQRPLP